jgi:hypothetical protein
MTVASDAELPRPDLPQTSVITNSQLYEASALAFSFLLVAISCLRQCDARFERKKLEVGVITEFGTVVRFEKILCGR